jgi:hypothetical protein
MDLCANVNIVLTKTDFYPAWRQIETLDRGHLSDHGIDLRVLPVSSALRQAAVAASDKELNTESGFAPPSSSWAPSRSPVCRSTFCRT